MRYALEDLRDDVPRVTGVAPAMLATAAANATPIDDVIVVGTLGRSALVDGLAAQGRIDAAPLRGAWEGFLVQAVAQPWPGVKRALVMAGSERRGAAGRQWLEVPGHGPTLSGMTVHPVIAPPLAPDDGMRLEYRLHLFNPGRVKVHAVLAPTLKLQPGAAGLRCAIGFAHEAVQVVDMHADTTEATWARHVTEPTVPQAGTHTLHFLALDAGVLLQRLVIDAGGLVPSALGPPEALASRLLVERKRCSGRCAVAGSAVK